jgi:NifU-like protein involved in Fe-S cluster formation
MSRFSETLMDHFQAPRNRGRLEGADATGVAGVPGQGRFMVLYIQVAEGRIAKAQFECHGCGVTIACGSALTELIVGLPIDDCEKVTCSDLVSALDGVPADRGDCPEFAMQALRNLVRQLMEQLKPA